MTDFQALEIQVCTRCGHRWWPRNLTKPTRCPNTQCRSPYWDKERRPLKIPGAPDKAYSQRCDRCKKEFPYGELNRAGLCPSCTRTVLAQIEQGKEDKHEE